MAANATTPGGPNRRSVVRAALIAAVVSATGCSLPRSEDAVGLPDNSEGLARIAADFIRDRNDLTPLLARLRPALKDYGQVFVGRTVVAAIRHYDGYWQNPRVLAPTDRHTEFRLSQVTTEELVAGTGAAATFPGSYRDVAPHLNAGLIVYRITFHEPDLTVGIDVDGFIYVNGFWRLFPTAWQVLTVDEPEHSH
jgi:hypothetical protein